MENKKVSDKLDMIRISKTYERNQLMYILQNDKSSDFTKHLQKHLDNLKELETQEITIYEIMEG